MTSGERKRGRPRVGWTKEIQNSMAGEGVEGGQC
jgi:hypothetical protein